jgi:two-component system OmpR family response regulator
VHPGNGCGSRVLRVLLVEDNIVIGDALRDHVVANGWSVDWSLDLRSAIIAIELQTYGLVLLDLHLPDGTGLDLLRHLGNRAQMPAVIILSAYDQFSDRAEGMKLGAADYLVKPFDLSEMIARIQELTRRPGPRQASHPAASCHITSPSHSQSFR